jgi:hypothetical protein
MFMKTITKNPRRETVTFGPGALESIKLTTWTNKHGVGKLRAAGDFMVYCGYGNEHTVAVNETSAAADHEGDEPSAAAHELVGYSLENFSCPCCDGPEL